MFKYIIDKIINYDSKKKHEELIKRHGGIQYCPYCTGIIQSGNGGGSREHPKSPILDILTCGVCQGESIWRFEFGMFYVGPYSPPKPKHNNCKSYSDDLYGKD